MSRGLLKAGPCPKWQFCGWKVDSGVASGSVSEKGHHQHGRVKSELVMRLWTYIILFIFYNMPKEIKLKKCWCWNLKLVLPNSKTHFMASSYLPEDAVGDISY